MKKSLTHHTQKELQVIHGNSRRLNRLLNKDHAHALLDMMRAHVDEITERYDNKDKHYLIETGDLIILSLELIKEAKQSPDAILFQCYPRFHKKILKLIKDQKDFRQC
ncbi:MAG: hypothetical protein HQL15_04100 [Candidatus Omnitrophica bacterium]|nr:hypothetical protein [Candidatus Omnitrophota bacterium]